MLARQKTQKAGKAVEFWAEGELKPFQQSCSFYFHLLVESSKHKLNPRIPGRHLSFYLSLRCPFILPALLKVSLALIVGFFSFLCLLIARQQTTTKLGCRSGNVLSPLLAPTRQADRRRYYSADGILLKKRRRRRAFEEI